MTTTSVNTNNPYPGLRPYQATEQTKFYGRDADTQALLTKILSNRLTLLFAATGVGKSSLLQAAVLPQLSAVQGLNLDVVYYNDWVAPPIQGLQHAVRAALVKKYDSISTNTTNVSLENFFRTLTPNTSHPLVIILDQFEEFFRYRFIHHAADFQPFIDQLADVILAPELKVSLVFSMREDFALELNAFKPHLPNPLFSHYYRLEKLGIDAAKAAITEPLLQAGYQYEPALLEELLKDLLSRDLTRDAASLAKGTQADSVEPPYLQIVCSQLWELDKNDPQKTLRLATYNKAGGAKGLLENYVNYVMKSFSDREKQVASKAFDHLISRRGTKMAHTPEDLAELVNLKPAEVANVMDKLEKARILRRQQRDQQVWYELYHDMFSGGIESWNTAWKNHMRLRRTLIGTAASLAAVAAIYFGVLAYLQSTSKHLRLGNGNNDRVEIYTGTSKFPDPFGQQHYFSETSTERGQLELDKRYPRRDIPDYPLVIRDLLGSQPLDTRVGLYISNGELCQYADLLIQTFSLNKPAPGCTVTRAKLRPTATATQATNAGTTNPNVSPDSDPMLMTMLVHLPELKTAWGFEQRQQLGQQFPQLLTSGMLGYDSRLGSLSTPASYTQEQLFNQAMMHMQQGSLNTDPRHFEVLIDWCLNPKQFTSTVTPMKPNEVAINLFDKSGLDKQVLVAVMQSMHLKPRLLAALVSANPQEREVASILSGIIPDPSFFEPIAQFATDKSSTTRQFALQSLFAIDTERALPLAAKLLADRKQPSELRSVLVRALGDSNSLQATPVLLALFQDTSEREELRMQAGEALGRLGATSAIPSLRAALSDANERTEARLGAIEGIKNANDQASISLLLARLNDVEERVDIRTACARALGELVADEASSSLLALIADPVVDENLKGTAIGALDYLADPAIVPTLLAYWQTLPPSNFLAIQITSILESRNDPQVNEVLKTKKPFTASPLISEKTRLEIEIANTITRPQYEPVHPTRMSTSLETANNGYMVLGTYPQKQALRTAMLVEDANRNPALLRLAVDKTNSLSIRVHALFQLRALDTRPELIQTLLTLTQDPRRQLRLESINALLRIGEAKDLLPWLSTTELTLEQLEAGLARFVSTSARPEAIATLLSFAQNDSSMLQTKAYQLLGDLKASEALPVLEDKLAALEEEYQTWRAIRDQQPTDTANDAHYKAWQQQLAAATPKHAKLATHYGYALAQTDAKRGTALLAHDLADVRTGASLAFNQAATATELQSLAEARMEQADDPLFQQASYLAIDKALTRLENTTEAKEIEALAAWQNQLSHSTDALSQRLAWTLTMIKHYQGLDQEFAQKYQLKRSQ